MKEGFGFLSVVSEDKKGHDVPKGKNANNTHVIGHCLNDDSQASNECLKRRKEYR